MPVRLRDTTREAHLFSEALEVFGWFSVHAQARASRFGSTPIATLARLGILGPALIAGLCAARTCAQQGAPQSTLNAEIAGKVMGANGQGVAGAVVRLLADGARDAMEVKSGAEGAFEIPNLAAGKYTLTAESGQLQAPSTSVLAAQGKVVAVVLVLVTGNPAGKAQGQGFAEAMEFADQPNFTVAGVTDWTAAGGHGSDVNLRASEALVDETVRLKAEGGKDPAKPDDEKSALSQKDVEQITALKGSGDFAQARSRLDDLLAHGETADLRRLSAEVDEALGDPLAAVHEFERAARLDPSEENYFAWGSELLLHRAVIEAREVFTRGTVAYPGSVRMQTALGAALFAGAHYDEAALRLCAASDLDPANTEPYLFLGRVVVTAPNPLPCVVPHLKRFAEMQATNPLANYFYAMAMWKENGQPSDAASVAGVEALLKKAVSLDAQCGPAWLQLGVLSDERKDYNGAISYFQKAVAADPEMSEAHYRLGTAYDRLGERDKAKLEFDLHETIDREQKAQVEQQRRAIKQFQVLEPEQTPDQAAKP
jgi:tetratricopeptide (TPR) repeat protein